MRKKETTQILRMGIYHFGTLTPGRVFRQALATRDAMLELEPQTISRLMAHMCIQRAHPRGRACPPFTRFAPHGALQLRVRQRLSHSVSSTSRS